MDRVEKLKEFLLQTPEDNFLQHALALEFIKMGNDMEARKLFEQILSRDENYTGSYYHLARLLERSNEREEALKCYEKGMAKAKEAGDLKTYNELHAGWEEMM
jgi:Tfp pilus assembly protein PilF